MADWAGVVLLDGADELAFGAVAGSGVLGAGTVVVVVEVVDSLLGAGASGIASDVHTWRACLGAAAGALAWRRWTGAAARRCTGAGRVATLRLTAGACCWCVVGSADGVCATASGRLLSTNGVTVATWG